MNFSIDNGLSRYQVAFVAVMFVFCGNALSGVDDVWNAAPATQDTVWAQARAGSVGPKNNGQSSGGFDGKWIRGSAKGSNTYGSGIIVSAVTSTARDQAVSISVDGVKVCGSAFSSTMNHTVENSCSVPVPSNSSWAVSGTLNVNLFVPR